MSPLCELKPERTGASREGPFPAAGDDDGGETREGRGRKRWSRREDDEAASGAEAACSDAVRPPPAIGWGIARPAGVARGRRGRRDGMALRGQAPPEACFQGAATHSSPHSLPPLPLPGALRPWDLPPLLILKGISTPGGGQTAVPPIVGREHENMMSASKGAIPYHSASSRSLLSTRSNVCVGSTSTMEKNLEPGSSRCEIIKHKAACAENDSLQAAADLSRVNPKSSEVARRILEHLDRTIPSPWNKPFESKFPVERKTLPLSGMTKVPNGQDNKLCPGFPNTSFLLGDNVIRGNAEVQKVNELSLNFKASVTDSESP